jgi:class 3 adenylate cyclase
VPFAAPGTVVVDDAVRSAAMASGSRPVMAALGHHVLKGFDEPVALFEVTAD